MVDMFLLKQIINPGEALKLKVLKLKKNKFRDEEFEHYPQDILFVRILTEIINSNCFFSVKKIAVKKIAEIFFRRSFEGKGVPELLQREIPKFLLTEGVFQSFNTAENTEMAIYELEEVYDLIYQFIVVVADVPETVKRFTVKLIDNHDMIMDIILRSEDEVVKRIALDKIYDYEDYKYLIFNLTDEKLCHAILDKLLFHGGNDELLEEISVKHKLEEIRKRAVTYLMREKKRIEILSSTPEKFTEEMVQGLESSKDRELIINIINKNSSDNVVLKALEKMRYTPETISKVDLNVWIRLISYLDKEIIDQLIDLHDSIQLLENIAFKAPFDEAQKKALLKLCRNENMDGIKENKDKLPEGIKVYAEKCIDSFSLLKIALSDDIQAEAAVEQVEIDKHLWKIVLQSENQNVRKSALRRIDFEGIERDEIEKFILEDYNRALSFYALSLVPIETHKRFIKDIILNNKDNNLRLEAINRLDKEKDKEFLLKLITNSDPFIIDAITLKFGDKGKVKELLRELKDISLNEEARKKKLRANLQLLFETESKIHIREIIFNLLKDIASSDIQDIKFEYSKHHWNEKRMEEYNLQSALNEIVSLYQRNYAISLDKDKGIVLSDKGEDYNVIYAFFKQTEEKFIRFYGIKNN